MVELRKRKTPPLAASPPQKKKTGAKATASKAAEEKPAASGPVEQPATKPDETAPEAADGAKTSSGPPNVGDTISLDGFGGEVETHDGTKVTLKKLVEESKAGVVLFTYPKASTPGCKLGMLHTPSFTVNPNHRTGAEWVDQAVALCPITCDSGLRPI